MKNYFWMFLVILLLSCEESNQLEINDEYRGKTAYFLNQSLNASNFDKFGTLPKIPFVGNVSSQK